MTAEHFILVVEDSPTELLQLCQWLEQAEYRVEAVSDGRRAMKRAQEGQPRLILMDIVLPGLNGFQATRALARDPATRHIPIVMLSSKSQETDRLWGLRQGARAYLTKPVSQSLLLRTVAELWQAS